MSRIDYVKDSIRPGITSKAEVQQNIGQPLHITQNPDNTETWVYQFHMDSDLKHFGNAGSVLTYAIIFLGNIVRSVSETDNLDKAPKKFIPGPSI